MANQVLESLGMLNNFLSQEVNRARVERKEDMANASAASIADNFLGLGQQATEADAQRLAIESIKDAALSNTLKENQGLIQSLYQDHVNTIVKRKAEAKQNAFDQYVATKYGDESAKAFGGDAFMRMREVDLKETQPLNYTDPEGRSYLQLAKEGPEGYQPVGKPWVLDSRTTAQKNQQEWDMYQKKEKFQAGLRYGHDIGLLRAKEAMDNNVKLVSDNDRPIKLVQGAMYELTDKGWAPYSGGVRKPSTKYAGVMASSKDKKLLDAKLEDKALALATEISSLGSGWERKFKDTMNTNEPKASTEKLALLLNTDKAALLEKMKGTYSDKKLAEMEEELKYFEENYKFSQGLAQNIKSENEAAAKAGIIRDEVSKALTRRSITTDQYRESWNGLKTDLQSADLTIQSAIKNAIKTATGSKKAPEEISFEDFANLNIDKQLDFFAKLPKSKK